MKAADTFCMQCCFLQQDENSQEAKVTEKDMRLETTDDPKLGIPVIISKFEDLNVPEMSQAEFDEVNGFIMGIFQSEVSIKAMMGSEGMEDYVAPLKETKAQSIESLKKWAQSGGNVNSWTPSGTSLLQYVYQFDLREIWEWFLDDLAADPNPPDKYARTTLSHLIMNLNSLDHIQISDLKYLLSKGADPNRLYDKNHVPPLFECCYPQTDSPEAIQLLLDAGAILDAVTQNIGTALHFACVNGASKAALYLYSNTKLNRSIKGITFREGSSGKSNMNTTGDEAIFAYCMTNCVNERMKQSSGASSSFELTKAFANAVHNHVPDVALDGVHLVPADWFMDQGCIPHYDSCVENNVLITPDKVENMHAKNVLFVSHRWDAKGHPDPDGNQFECLVKFMAQTEKDFDFIWADYSCICQTIPSPLFFKNLINIPTAVFMSTDVLVIPKRDTKKLPKVKDYHPGNFEVRYSNLEDYTNRGWCELEAFLCLITGCEMYISFNINEDEFFLKVHGGFEVFGLARNTSLVQQYYNDTLYQKYKGDSTDIAPEDLTVIWDWENQSKGLKRKELREPSHTMQIGTAALRSCDVKMLEKVFNMSLEENELEGELRKTFESFGDLADDSDRITLLRFLLCVLGYAMGYINVNGQITTDPFSQSSLKVDPTNMIKEDLVVTTDGKTPNGNEERPENISKTKAASLVDENSTDISDPDGEIVSDPIPQPSLMADQALQTNTILKQSSSLKSAQKQSKSEEISLAKPSNSKEGRVVSTDGKRPNENEERSENASEPKAASMVEEKPTDISDPEVVEISGTAPKEVEEKEVTSMMADPNVTVKAKSGCNCIVA